MTKGSDASKRSPNIIARLMGLDPLPPSSYIVKQKGSRTLFNQSMPVNFPEHRVCYEGHSFRNNDTVKDMPEFKDIYEVLGSSKAREHTNPALKKAVSRLKPEEKIAFIRKTFMDVKRLSTDEKLRHSKEFHDALEILDSNKDIFLKILQEPDSWFAKHLSEMKESRHLSRITVLKSANKSKWEGKKESSKIENEVRSFMQAQQDAVTTSHLSSSHYEDRTKSSCHPTKIVILKPSLHKVPSSVSVSPSINFHASHHSTGRKVKEARRTGRHSVFPDVGTKPDLFQNIETVKQRPQDFRKIVRDFPQQVKPNIQTPKWEKPTVDDYRSSRKEFRVSRSDSRHTHRRHTCDSLSSYSGESYVCREARKHLSEQWKLSQNIQGVGVVGGQRNTLSEVLSFHDADTFPTSVGSAYYQRLLKDDLFKEYPLLGANNNDGWKEGHHRSFPRSRSLPSSSPFFCDNAKTSSKYEAGDSEDCIQAEVRHGGTEKSAYIHQEGSFHSWNAEHAVINYNVFSAAVEADHVRDIHMMLVNKRELGKSDGEFDPRGCVRADIDASEIGDRVEALEDDSKVGGPLLDSVASIMQSSSQGSVGTDQKDFVLEEALTDDYSQEESCYHVIEAESLPGSKDAEQPSPVSVLELPFEEERTSAECFQRVTADLHGLRMQLELLKLESAEPHLEGATFNVSSDEESDGCRDQAEKPDITQVSQKGGSREFSFLFDVLWYSGLNASSQESIFATCRSAEFPVDMGLFQKLEIEYGGQASWSKAERKLLFDRINCGLSQILGVCINQKPWIGEKRLKSQGWSLVALAEEVWDVIAGEELLCNSMLGTEAGWMALSDDIDAIGRELEGFLVCELIEEVLAGLQSSH